MKQWVQVWLKIMFQFLNDKNLNSQKTETNITKNLVWLGQDWFDQCDWPVAHDLIHLSWPHNK